MGANPPTPLTLWLQQLLCEWGARDACKVQVQRSCRHDRVCGRVAQYEDETVQAIALSVIPEECLRKEAESALAEERAAQQEDRGSAGSATAGKPMAALTEEDAFVRRLLSWFKRDFFTWVRHVLLQGRATVAGRCRQPCSFKECRLLVVPGSSASL